MAIKNSYYLEEVVKQVIKNYLNLTQNKGTRKVFSVLEDAFTITNGSLDIYKTILVKITSELETLEGEDTETKKFRFLKANFEQPNVLAELLKNISFGTDFLRMINEDQYWTESNTPVSELNNLGLSSANTKYIISEYTIDIAKNYILTRCILALIDYFFNTLGENQNGMSFNDIRIGSEAFPVIAMDGNDISLSEAIDVLRSLYREFLNMTFGIKDTNFDYDGFMSTIFSTENERDKKLTAYKINVPTEKLIKYINKELNRELVKETNQNISKSRKAGTKDGEQIADKPIEVLNHQAILNDFSDSDLNLSSVEPQIEFIKQCIDSLIPLYIMSCVGKKIEYCDTDTNTVKISENTITPQAAMNILGKLYQPKTNDVKDLFTDLLNKSLYLPYNFIDNNFRIDDLNCFAHTWLYDIYETLFLQQDVLDAAEELETAKITESKDILHTESKEKYLILDEYSGSADKLSNGIIVACNSLNEFLKISSSIMITLSESDRPLLNFLQACLEYFISFTTQLHTLTYKNKYSSMGESVTPIDGVKIQITNTQIDTVYYDEQLFAEIIDIQQFTN